MLANKTIASLLLGILPLWTAQGFSAVTIENGSLEVRWNHGSADCAGNSDPAIQIHAYNKNLVIMRQNKCVNYEAPFMYLLFGAQRAILFDTGATKSSTSFPLQKTVERLLVEHYGAGKRPAIELVVAHTHAHGDHIAGDSQFVGRPHTTVVGTSPRAVADYFGFSNWPNGSVQYDLGGRVLELMPIPGHEDSHIAVHGEQTGILLSGDSLYPGRLYVDDWATYRRSVSQLNALLASKRITHVLGAHIEMTATPGVDYPIGTLHQPQEHELALSKDSLDLLHGRLLDLGAIPTRDVQADFIIHPL